MALAERGELDMVATLKKTPERKVFLAYPSAPVLSNPVAVFTLRSRPLDFNDKTDLIGLRGGVTRGNLFGNGVDELLKGKLFNEFSKVKSKAVLVRKISEPLASVPKRAH